MYRIAFAKFTSITIMTVFPEKAQLAIGYITDIFNGGVFSKSKHKQCYLYALWAYFSILENDINAAKEALKKARIYEITIDDTLVCDDIDGNIHLYEGQFPKAIDLFNIQYGKLKLYLQKNAHNSPKKQLETKQRIARTLNSIAKAYELNGDPLNAYVNYEKAIYEAEQASLLFEKTVFLLNLGRFLSSNNEIDPAIEKIKMALELAYKLGFKERFTYATDMLTALLSQKGDLGGAQAVCLEAFNSTKDLGIKLHFSRLNAELSAELGDTHNLENQINFISSHASLDNGIMPENFEEWADELKSKCDQALPAEIKNHPGSHFLFNENDPFILKMKQQLIGVKKDLSNKPKELDKAALELLLKIPASKGKAKEKKEVEHNKTFSNLFSQLIASKSLPERAYLAYQLGSYYFENLDFINAEKWFKITMNAEAASLQTILWAKIGLAQVHLEKQNHYDDEDAKHILDDVAAHIENTEDQVMLAFCKYNQGCLEARSGNYESAKNLFEQSLYAAQSKKSNQPSLKKLLHNIGNSLSLIQEYQFCESTPRMDLHSLLQELLFLRTWYPEYEDCLTEYWWYYNKYEPIKNILISDESACLLYLSEKENICWYSEALKSLFMHSMFATKNVWKNNKHPALRTIPVPENVPFPYSTFMIHKKQKNGNHYGYYSQSGEDDTAYSNVQKYSYVRVQDDEASFDYNRIPRPITLCYLGYQYPGIVHEIMPIIRDNYGSSRWWVGEEFGESVIKVLNFACRFRIIPVIRYNDILREKEVKIVQIHKIILPYHPDNENNEEEKNIQIELQEITGITDEKTATLLLREVVKQISKLQEKSNVSITIHLGLVRFSYYTWPKAPSSLRIYPVVILMAQDEQICMESNILIKKQVALANAVSYQNKILFYVSHSHWTEEQYVKHDAMMVLKYAKEADNNALQEFAQKVINACDDYSKGKIEKNQETDIM